MERERRHVCCHGQQVAWSADERGLLAEKAGRSIPMPCVPFSFSSYVVTCFTRLSAAATASSLTPLLLWMARRSSQGSSVCIMTTAQGGQGSCLAAWHHGLGARYLAQRQRHGCGRLSFTRQAHTPTAPSSAAYTMGFP